MRIAFRAKVQKMYTVNDDLLYEFIVVPKLTRKHVNMGEARSHHKYGGLANSSLFESGVLSGLRKTVFKDSHGGPDQRIVRLDQIPHGVQVDTSGFLAHVSFEA